MQINRIDDEISVSPQISASDLPAIVEAGFKTIICNRPDGEETGQQIFVEIEAAANKNGITIVYQPVDGRKVTSEDVNEFDELLASSEKPVFAYCRTGTRCTVLWCRSQSGKLSANEILMKASGAGYDMNKLAPML